MAGVKGRSGPRPKPPTDAEMRGRLLMLTRPVYEAYQEALEAEDIGTRLKAAGDLLPYLASKMPTQTQIAGPDGGPIQTSVDHTWPENTAELFAEVASLRETAAFLRWQQERGEGK